jgi:hypothetical protein
MVKCDNAWLKLYYKLAEWEWFKNSKTLHLFIYLLLQAQISDSTFCGVPIHRGEAVVSYKTIADATGLSTKEIRTGFQHLEKTQEVAITRYPKFSVISIANYDRYQAKGHSKGQGNGQRNGQSKGSHRGKKGTHNKIDISKDISKKDKANALSKNKKEGACAPISASRDSREWEKQIPEEFWGEFESLEAFKEWWAR